MAQSKTAQRNGHTRQRPATAKAKQASKSGPRRGSANGSRAKTGGGDQGRAATSSRAKTGGGDQGRAATSSRAKTGDGDQGRAASRSRTKTAAGTARAKTSPSRNGDKPAADAEKTGETATAKRNQSPVRKAKRKAATAKKAAKAGRAVDKATPGSMTRKLALKALKRVTAPIAEAGLQAIRNAADRAASSNGPVSTVTDVVSADNPMEKLAHKRLPIQRSVDIAVPLRVVWEEWQALEFLPEGAHTVGQIEREGDELFGHINGSRNAAWSAEILDEREQQSFAWQSHEGSDCAGLITFHEISERLTRLELNLDVIPTGVAEAAQLASHIADRRAEAELRRFKARLELMNPDLYEQDDQQQADEPAPEDEPAEQDNQGN